MLMIQPQRASVVIINHNQILLIHRFSGGKEYFILPGGGVKAGEDPVQAAVREIKEETSLDIEIDKKLWEYKDKFDNRLNHIFLAKNFSGNLKLGGPEKQRNSAEDRYILEWHLIEDLKTITFYPLKIKKKIIESLRR